MQALIKRRKGGRTLEVESSVLEQRREEIMTSEGRWEEGGKALPLKKEKTELLLPSNFEA